MPSSQDAAGMANKPLAHVPLSVFSQSSSLMSDRASQAMERALRNASPPSEENAPVMVNESYQSPEKEQASTHLVFHQDMFADWVGPQKNYEKRDPAELFSASALINDKDETTTQCASSSPSLFHTRGGTGDLALDDAHPAGEMFSDGDDAEVHLRATRSLTVSGPLGSDRSVGSDVETEEGDTTMLLNDCAKEDLDLVESALRRLLRKGERVAEKQSHEDFTDSRDERLEESEGSRLSAGDIDMQLLSSLLDQVQGLRAQKPHRGQRARATRSLTRSGSSSWDITKRPGGKEKRFRKDEIRKSVEAATQAAKAAAEAAKAAAASVAKNSDAIEKLLTTLSPSFSNSIAEQVEHQVRSRMEKTDNSEESSDSEDIEKIAKKIVRQNRYTHVVLGVMLVSSFVWRYIVVKVVKRVKSKVSDPWGYVGGMLTDGFRNPAKEKDATADGASEGSGGLPIKLPSLLQGEREKEEIEATITDGKEEQRFLNFGNILQIKPDSGN